MEYLLEPDWQNFDTMAAKLTGAEGDGLKGELEAWRLLLNDNSNRANIAAVAVAMIERELGVRGLPSVVNDLNGVAHEVAERARCMVRAVLPQLAGPAKEAAVGPEVLGNPADTIREMDSAEVVGELQHREAQLNTVADAVMCNVDLIRLLRADCKRRGLDVGETLNFSARQIVARPWFSGHN